MTTSTVITTIDENAALEAYIQIPLDRSPDLRLGLPVQLLDGDGKVVATNPITFVAPRVDDATQTVLVKSALREVPPALRVQQFVRARVVWRKAPGLTHPDHRRLAGQRPVFLLRGRARPERPGRAPAARAGWRTDRQRLRRHRRGERRRQGRGLGHPEDRRRRPRQGGIDGRHTFIRRPILASVCSLVLILAGAVAIPTMPVAQYPAAGAAADHGDRVLHRRQRAGSRNSVTTPLEQAINGVEGMPYMTSSSTNSGVSTINVTFDITRDQDLAQVDVQNRVNQTLGRMPAEVRTTGITVQKQATGFVMAVGVSRKRANTTRCSSATTWTSTSRTR